MASYRVGAQKAFKFGNAFSKVLTTLSYQGNLNVNNFISPIVRMAQINKTSAGEVAERATLHRY